MQPHPFPKLQLAATALMLDEEEKNNNNTNIYLPPLGCYPVAVVILHVNKT